LGYGFLANLIVCLGFAPSLDSCAVCDEENNLVGFYPAGGGVVCRKCLFVKKQQDAKVYPIRPVDLQALQWLFSKQWEKMVEQNTEIANRLVFLYVQYHSEKKLNKISKLL
jgi:recombinational DNA repair protein (RecF pathway)